MKDGESMEDIKREAQENGLLDLGATLGIMVEDGVAKAMSDSPADIAAAKGMQEWLEAEGGNPNLYVFKAVVEAGITELNGINLVEAVAELEAREKAEADAPQCQATAGMYVYAFGLVCSVLEDLATHAMGDGDVTRGLRLIMARSAVMEIGEKAASAYHGLPIEAEAVHDLFMSLGLFCPDKSGSTPEDTSYRNGDRNTGRFNA